MSDDDRSGWIGLALFVAFYLILSATVYLVIHRIDQLATK